MESKLFVGTYSIPLNLEFAELILNEALYVELLTKVTADFGSLPALMIVRGYSHGMVPALEKI